MATKTWYWLGLCILALSLSSSPTAQSTRTWFGAKLDAICLRGLPMRALVQMREGRPEPDFPQIGVDVGEHQAAQWRAAAEQARKEIEGEMWRDQLTHLRVHEALSPEVLCPRVRVKLTAPHVPVAAPVIVIDKDPI